MQSPTTLPFNESLSKFESKHVVLINNYYGLLNHNKIDNCAKIVIYCLIGENREISNIIENLSKLFPVAYKFIISPIKYQTNISFNGEIIWQPTAYAGYYSKCMPKLEIDNICERKLEKYFLSLNNRADYSRHALWQCMTKFNILEKSYFSYLFEDRENEGFDNLYQQLQNLTYPNWFSENINWEEQKLKLPIRIDNFNRNSWSYDNIDYYRKSFLSIVSETYTENFITEKSMKPLAYGHPFIIINCKGSIEILKNLGFDTFQDINNDLYDKFISMKKLEFCLQKIIQLSKINLSILEKQLFLLKDKILHNYNMFWNVLPKKDELFISNVIEPKIISKITELK